MSCALNFLSMTHTIAMFVVYYTEIVHIQDHISCDVKFKITYVLLAYGKENIVLSIYSILHCRKLWV
jgi:hypothetical protein